jgi:DNA replication ATP-dependent helicase Dna2
VFVEDKNGIFHVISLRQSWFDTRCTKGSYVHVIGKFNDQGNCTVDDNDNMLILHPDHLISALVVADSFGCLRRAVLQDRIKATSDPSPPQTYGTMLHEIFQEAMKANRWDTDWLNNTIDMITAQHIEDLYAIKLSIAQAVEHMRSKMPELQKWAATFVKSRPTV